MLPYLIFKNYTKYSHSYIQVDICFKPGTLSTQCAETVNVVVSLIYEVKQWNFISHSVYILAFGFFPLFSHKSV